MTPTPVFSSKTGNWRDRLDVIVQTMREMSLHTDAQAMGRAYGSRFRTIFPTDRFVALSRRNLEKPDFLITRCSDWKHEVNPWLDRDLLPKFNGGLLSELIYSDEPWVIDDLKVDANDPAIEYLEGMGSLLAIPHYDEGKAINMVLMMRKAPEAFIHDELPEIVWINNLYGRATYSLVMAERARAALETVDQEMRTVATIQRSLLPANLPNIPGMGLAAHYQTSHRAGGDYYDFFPLPDGSWGILIADVSGHGTPAAVFMAVTHSIAHSYPGPHGPPSELLAYVNRVLADKYTRASGAFVTAFYGIYNPQTKSLAHSSAGHPPPRLKRCSDGSLVQIDGDQGLPLGIETSEKYVDHVVQLQTGDQIVFYTDGITESTNAAGEMFGTTRLDRVLENCSVGAGDLLKDVLSTLDEFVAGRPPDDDRTVLVAKVK